MAPLPCRRRRRMWGGPSVPGCLPIALAAASRRRTKGWNLRAGDCRGKCPRHQRDEGNASGINDGACALFLASEKAATRFGLTPVARVVGSATAGVEPKLMGVGPIPAIRKLLR